MRQTRTSNGNSPNSPVQIPTTCLTRTILNRRKKQPSKKQTPKKQAPIDQKPHQKLVLVGFGSADKGARGFILDEDDERLDKFMSPSLFGEGCYKRPFVKIESASITKMDVPSAGVFFLADGKLYSCGGMNDRVSSSEECGMELLDID